MRSPAEQLAQVLEMADFCPAIAGRWLAGCRQALPVFTRVKELNRIVSGRATFRLASGELIE